MLNNPEACLCFVIMQTPQRIYIKCHQLHIGPKLELDHLEVCIQAFWNKF